MLNSNLSCAIMQPYLFPYIGYFQMIHSVDIFVFYDDVNFINRGWINRNRILINSEPKFITMELLKASQNKLINEIEIGNNQKKILNSISLAYKKAPYFSEVFPLIEECFNSPSKMISELAIYSIKCVSKYLNVSTSFEMSSELYGNTRGFDKADRLIEICKLNGSGHYVNAMGGLELYDKMYFSKNDLKLNFIKTGLTPYKQFNEDFVAGLSIIDVLMFNSKVECQKLLNNYELI